MIDLFERVFDDSYETILQSLSLRAERCELTYEMLNAELESIYKYEGLDWEGRGDSKQAEIEGTILAYQIFMKDYENKKNNAG